MPMQQTSNLLYDVNQNHSMRVTTTKMTSSRTFSIAVCDDTRFLMVRRRPWMGSGVVGVIVAGMLCGVAAVLRGGPTLHPPPRDSRDRGNYFYAHAFSVAPKASARRRLRFLGQQPQSLIPQQYHGGNHFAGILRSQQAHQQDRLHRVHTLSPAFQSLPHSKALLARNSIDYSMDDYDDGTQGYYDYIDDDDDDDEKNEDDDKEGNDRLSSTRKENDHESLLREERSDRWILFVDDEEPIRDAVGQLLISKGYQVTACVNGVEALAAAKRLLEPLDSDYSGSFQAITSASRNIIVPDVIVSDVRMPEMDGLELLQRLRDDDLLVQVPVVLLTAKGMTEDRIAGYDAGADAYIPKPFDADELVAIIDGLIERQELVNGMTMRRFKTNSLQQQQQRRSTRTSVSGPGNDDGFTNGNGQRQNTANTVAPTNESMLQELRRDLDDIKRLLLEQGGGGVGNGWVQTTNVFLTPYEQEVLELLCEGLMNKEIASRTQKQLSVRRVEQLLTSMYRKTKVKNRTELVRWAISTGYVDI